jgi:hypothetical protein
VEAAGDLSSEAGDAFGAAAVGEACVPKLLRGRTARGNMTFRVGGPTLDVWFSPWLRPELLTVWFIPCGSKWLDTGLSAALSSAASSAALSSAASSAASSSTASSATSTATSTASASTNPESAIVDIISNVSTSISVVATNHFSNQCADCSSNASVSVQRRIK